MLQLFLVYIYACVCIPGGCGYTYVQALVDLIPVHADVFSYKTDACATTSYKRITNMHMYVYALIVHRHV